MPSLFTFPHDLTSLVEDSDSFALIDLIFDGVDSDSIFDGVDSISTFPDFLDSPVVSDESTAISSSQRAPRAVSWVFPQAPPAKSAPVDGLQSLVHSKSSRGTNAKPSSYIREALATKRLRNADESTPVLKTKKKKAKTDYPLHRACSSANTSLEEIDRLLGENPSAASMPAKLYTMKPVYNPVTRKPQKKLVKESYTYPLNIAIKNKASPEVIRMLIDAAPDVLLKKDGDKQESSLSILVKNLPHEVATVDHMLLTRPRCASARDAYSNTVAHVGSSCGASLPVMRHIVIMYPEALSQRNFHDQTPLELAQRSIGRCTDEVASFLYERHHEASGITAQDL